MPPTIKPRTQKKTPPIWVLLRQGWGPYRFLAGYIKPYLVRFIAGLVCGGLSGAISGFLPVVTIFAFSHLAPDGANAVKPSLASWKNAGGLTGPAFHPTLIVWLACLAIPATMIL